MCCLLCQINWQASQAIATFLAVLAALYVSYRDRHDRLRDQGTAKRQERILGLIGLHELCVRCSERTREYWGLPKLTLPSFRLPSISYEEIVKLAPRVFPEPDDVKSAIITISEYHHLNDKFDAVQEAFDRLQEYRTRKPMITVSGEDLLQDELEQRVNSAAATLNAATPVVYKINYNFMSLIERQDIDGKPLSQIVRFKQGSHTEPVELQLPQQTTVEQ